MHLLSSFSSFIQAGFECSTHRVKSGRRLDVVAATRHDVFVKQDYFRLFEIGIRTVREGLRWHLIERLPGNYDFSSIIPLLDAAQETGMEQVTDLFHFGWPDYLDIFGAEFVDSFGEFALRFARLLKTRGLETPWIAPMNEMSFVAWAGGDVRYINPFEEGRGAELKLQLVRAGLRAAKAIRSEIPGARLVWPEPVIHIAGDSNKQGDEAAAEAYRLSMFEPWDMLCGRLHPELGGHTDLLQMIGVNFYDRNEWINHGKTLRGSDALYRPLHVILLEVWNRYHVPIIVSETGTEGAARAEWFADVCAEVREAARLGVSMEGVCLYPIVNHPGWDDDRHCYNGLFDYPGVDGEREVYMPLAMEIKRQQQLNSEVFKN